MLNLAALRVARACWGDLRAGWRNSLVIGLLLSIVYVVALLAGCLAGSVIFDLLARLALFWTGLIDPLAAEAIGLVVLLVVLVNLAAFGCYLARGILLGLATLASETSDGGLCYGALAVFVTSVVAILLLLGLGLYRPPVASESIGWIALAGVACLLFSGWIGIRYLRPGSHHHWTGRARVYRHDIAAAHHQLTLDT